ELIDNSVDACEQAGVIHPVVEVQLDEDAVSVEDNGPGLPEETLLKSLDYAVRVSDKSHYISPTRGQLGNALKCVWAAPFVATHQGRLEVFTKEFSYEILVTLDRIAGKPSIQHHKRVPVVKTGTLIRMYWPEISSYLDPEEDGDFYHVWNLLCDYAVC